MEPLRDLLQVHLKLNRAMVRFVGQRFFKASGGKQRPRDEEPIDLRPIFSSVLSMKHGSVSFIAHGPLDQVNGKIVRFEIPISTPKSMGLLPRLATEPMTST
eukprot:4246185-Amphidinium_carterae.1